MNGLSPVTYSLNGVFPALSQVPSVPTGFSWSLLRPRKGSRDLYNLLSLSSAADVPALTDYPSVVAVVPNQLPLILPRPLLCLSSIRPGCLVPCD